MYGSAQTTLELCHKVKSSSKDDDDDFSFIDSFDLGGVSRTYVIDCYKQVVTAYSIIDKKAYFLKWWQDKGGEVIQAYNEREGLKMQRQEQERAEAKRAAEANNPTTFANWCKARGINTGSLSEAEKGDLFTQYRKECKANGH